MTKTLRADGFLTVKGRALFEVARTYWLENYFQRQVGNIIIPDEDFSNSNGNEAEWALALIKENPEWVLGHDEENGYWYITLQEDLNL